jgi:toxin ParE1/3/4
VTAKSWRVVLGSEAENDFVRILTYTRDIFGPRQEAIYETTILAAIAELDSGPEVLGSLARDNLRLGIRSMHVARHGRRGRHVIMYRARHESVIDVIRILHDAMDFARHVPADID